MPSRLDRGMSLSPGHMDMTAREMKAMRNLPGVAVSAGITKVSATASVVRRFTSAWGWGMRYVIGICFITGFLIWDAGYNDGQYLDSFVRELRRIVSFVT